MKKAQIQLEVCSFEILIFFRENRCIQTEKRRNVMRFRRALHVQFVYIFFGSVVSEMQVS